MFVILLDYIVPIEVVDKHVEAHRSYVRKKRKENVFMMAGPKIPRSGGVLLSPLKDRKALDAVLQEDPFWVHQIATYTVIEFKPIEYHQKFSEFIEFL